MSVTCILPNQQQDQILLIQDEGNDHWQLPKSDVDDWFPVAAPQAAEDISAQTGLLHYEDATSYAQELWRGLPDALRAIRNAIQ